MSLTNADIMSSVLPQLFPRRSMTTRGRVFVLPSRPRIVDPYRDFNQTAQRHWMRDAAIPLTSCFPPRRFPCALQARGSRQPPPHDSVRPSALLDSQQTRRNRIQPCGRPRTHPQLYTTGFVFKARGIRFLRLLYENMARQHLDLCCELPARI